MIVRLLLVICAAALHAGCAGRYVHTERGPQAYYQTGWPVHDTSLELERVLRSVRRIQVTGHYRTFRFARADAVVPADLRTPSTYARAAERFTFDHTRAGTATIVQRTRTGLTLVTAEHITRLPDTLIVFHPSTEEDAGGRYVESVSILMSSRSIVAGLPDAHPFTVMARDSAADIAAIRVALHGADQRADLPALRARAGDPARLVWGSFVYVVGFPRGHRMVTRAIVSEPGPPPDHPFLLDGLFNPGISGGLILAVRGDTGALEWVGLAVASSATSEFLLVPSQAGVEEYGMLVPYDGRVHLERVPRIDYGITFSVPVTAVRRFLSRSNVAIGS